MNDGNTAEPTKQPWSSGQVCVVVFTLTLLGAIGLIVLANSGLPRTERRDKTLAKQVYALQPGATLDDVLPLFPREGVSEE